ncbi:MAG: hypothetical protein IIA87_05785 [Nanoarchaeota archaeon]|nr:hypothetical protein [Nanoarchaeota archaeon]
MVKEVNITDERTRELERFKSLEAIARETLPDLAVGHGGSTGPCFQIYDPKNQGKSITVFTNKDKIIVNDPIFYNPAKALAMRYERLENEGEWTLELDYSPTGEALPIASA